MWLKLTRDDNTKELLNMALCHNVEPRDDERPGSTLRFFAVYGDDVVIDVKETIDDLAAVLGAIGKT